VREGTEEQEEEKEDEERKRNQSGIDRQLTSGIG
jgi:hypothetical protein